MKSTILLLVSLFAIQAQAMVDQIFIDSLEPGGRNGMHGMVVFGKGPYYMAHIPMLNMPHDIQIVTRVKLLHADGISEVSGDFSSDTFTIRPVALEPAQDARFSLNDFTRGEIKKYRGTIHLGSFELNGPVIREYESIYVLVEERLLVRHLPSEASLDYLEFADAENSYRVNLIERERNRQEILNSTKKLRLWCVLGPDFFNPCRNN